MENKIKCAVTGKNIFEIGNGQSETYYKNVEIKRSIYKQISELSDSGITDFMCNAEYGFPLWACEIIIKLREIHKRQSLSLLRLHIVKPHEEQGHDWSDEVHERFCAIHEKSDKVSLLYRHFREDCYKNSERIMIDNCDILLTDDENTFAAQYAELHGKKFIICKNSLSGNPLSQSGSNKAL
ncbi:MAG: DUF1273 domain-containing protein [Oscillospiraceae bacterium]|nr:DUF1273 domain-containing protein [Oscillospiraceae bacterium]